MQILSITPAIWYNDGGIKTFDWIDTDNKMKRAIRSGVALDNSVVITDSGFSWGDMAMVLDIPYEADSWNKLQDWLQGYPEILISRIEGVYAGILKQARPGEGRITLNISVTDKVTTGV